jgi:hypothetical protein
MFGLPPFDGANAQGNAMLADLVTSPGTPDPSYMGPYTGQAHFWYGLSYNANGQFYLGETEMFKGTGPSGSISLTTNPGFTVSASGHNSGWGQLTVTCS